MKSKTKQILEAGAREERRERGRRGQAARATMEAGLRVSRLGHGTPAAIPVSRFAAGLWETRTCRLSPERADDGETPFLSSSFPIHATLFVLLFSPSFAVLARAALPLPRFLTVENIRWNWNSPATLKREILLLLLGRWFLTRTIWH